MNKIKRSKAIHIEEGTVDDSYLQSLCFQSYDVNDTISTSTGKWQGFRDFLLNVSQPCSEMLSICRFASEEIACEKIFATVITDEGLCCTFNSVHPKYQLLKFNSTVDDLVVNKYVSSFKPLDWTPEGGFTTELESKSYPRPTSGAGSHMGLYVMLNTAIYDYYCSTTNSAGFKILLHNPTETPKIADYGFTVSPGDECRVVITPRISDASNLIRKIPQTQRQCVFANEGNLTYFRTYSRKNCQMECESRIIEQYCGCVLYFMPRTREDTNICNRKDWKCYAEIKLIIDLSLNDSFQCNCLPACFEISYGAELSTTKLQNNGFIIREEILMHMDSDFIRENIALIYIYYEESFFRSSTKEELIGFTEFLSNTGGLLGLFMGFSVVSLIEIFYFLTLRPYCARKRYLISVHNFDGSKSIDFKKQMRNEFRCKDKLNVSLFKNKRIQQNGELFTITKQNNSLGLEDVPYPFMH